MTRDKAIKIMYDDIETNISSGLMKELPIRVVKQKVLEAFLALFLRLVAICT
jgi:hypothetical protein